MELRMFSIKLSLLWLVPALQPNSPLHFKAAHLPLILKFPTMPPLTTRCPPKKWDLILVIKAVNPTFFKDTLYLKLPLDSRCKKKVDHFKSLLKGSFLGVD